MTVIYWPTCPNGHDMRNGNRYVSPTGKQQCRICKKEQNAKRAKATTCKYGHDLTDPNNHSWANGRKRCKICKRESDRKTSARRRAGIHTHEPVVRTYPHKYREWARQTWRTMTPSDQLLVRHALANMELPT